MTVASEVTPHPLVRRVLAPNPGPFTATGTQTHIVGTSELAVIDPGPDIPAHLDAILAAVGDARVTAIVCTHQHRDHSPLAVALKAATGAPVMGCLPVASTAFDETYAPERVLMDGERIAADSWTLEAVATPGHTSNHLCFSLNPDGAGGGEALFSGDHVMGWSTTVVVPPDGDMSAYLASLDRLLARHEPIYFPAHGDPVEKPQRLVRGMIGHRRQREGQVLRALGQGTTTIAAMVSAMYPGLDPRLVQGAQASVYAHLLDLERRGRVARRGDDWALAA